MSLCSNSHDITIICSHGRDFDIFTHQHSINIKYDKLPPTKLENLHNWWFDVRFLSYDAMDDTTIEWKTCTLIGRLYKSYLRVYNMLLN